MRFRCLFISNKLFETKLWLLLFGCTILLLIDCLETAETVRQPRALQLAKYYTCQVTLLYLMFERGSHVTPLWGSADTTIIHDSLSL